jgi:hypothetical protein
MLSADDIEADRAAMRLALAAVEEARRALLDRLGGGEVVAVPDEPDDQWPPDPMTINRFDGTWLLVKTAKDVVGCSIDTIYRRIGTEDIAVKVGGVWWVNRARLLGGPYPKRPA